MYTTQSKKRIKQQNKAFRNKEEYMQKEQKKEKLQMKHDKRTKEHCLPTPGHHQGQNKKYELQKNRI